MSRAESWEAVARALGERLAHHAYCEEGHVKVEADCPFCADLAAYLRFAKKAGLSDPRSPIAGTESVSIWDLRVTR